MMPHALLLAVLLGAGVGQQAHPCDSITAPVVVRAPFGVGWCHVSEPSTVTLTWTVMLNGNPVFSGPLTAIGIPSAAGMRYYETPKTLMAPVGVHVVTVRVVEAGQPSTIPVVSLPLSLTVEAAPPQVDPQCVAPLGANAVQIFPTRLQSATFGTKATVSFQLGSPGSPVTQLEVRLNQVTVATVTGEDLTEVGSMWFPRPTVVGSYAVSLYARNEAGCERVQSTTYVINR